MWRRKKQKESDPISQAHALACTPVAHPSVTVEMRSEGLIRLIFPMQFRPWFVRVTKRMGLDEGKPQIKRLDLDEMGTTAWKLIDGNNSVQDIVDDFTKRYQLLPREAELSVAAFMKQLGQRGILVMRPPGDATKPQKEGGA